MSTTPSTAQARYKAAFWRYCHEDCLDLPEVEQEALHQSYLKAAYTLASSASDRALAEGYKLRQVLTEVKNWSPADVRRASPFKTKWGLLSALFALPISGGLVAYAWSKSIWLIGVAVLLGFGLAKQLFKWAKRRHKELEEPYHPARYLAHRIGDELGLDPRYVTPSLVIWLSIFHKKKEETKAAADRAKSTTRRAATMAAIDDDTDFASTGGHPSNITASSGYRKGDTSASRGYWEDDILGQEPPESR